jgi:hypothetical protein
MKGGFASSSRMSDLVHRSRRVAGESGWSDSDSPIAGSQRSCCPYRGFIWAIAAGSPCMDGLRPRNSRSEKTQQTHEGRHRAVTDLGARCGSGIGVPVLVATRGALQRTAIRRKVGDADGAAAKISPSGCRPHATGTAWFAIPFRRRLMIMGKPASVLSFLDAHLESNRSPSAIVPAMNRHEKHL